MSNIILITGGCGFVGGNLAVKFAEDGYDVIAVDNFSRPGSHLNIDRVRAAGATVRQCDMRLWSDVSKLPTFDVMLMTAAQPSAVAGLHDPSGDINSNVIAVANALEACRRDESSIIFWSTNKVYPADEVNAWPVLNNEKTQMYEWAWAPVSSDQMGRVFRPHTNLKYVMEPHPVDPDTLWRPRGISRSMADAHGGRSVYGATKLAAETLIREYSEAFSVPAIINRFSCLAGPYQWGSTEQGWVAHFVVSALLGRTVDYIGWNGYQVRDVLHVDDLYALVRKQVDSVANSLTSFTYNVGGGPANLLSPRSLVALLQRALDIDPAELVRNDSATPRYADHRMYISDNYACSKNFDWEPTRSVERVVVDIINWAQANLDDLRKTL